MVRIEINGVEVEVPQGSMVIEAADQLDVPIPRFCYHKKLSIAANCRMCLVEIEKAPKPLPACATPVTEGMKIWTNSEQSKEAQRAVMEFLLINHPLDCPICDQGGECELQDLSLGYGKDISRFTEEKRVVDDKNLGPLIATDMTRCIHCTRCVRFGEEISGQKELGAVNRGENTRITTFVEQNVNSEVSGNVIDLCPVGALTSKPYRFTARAWELSSSPSISMHDCLGSNSFYHIRRNQVMRVVPRENEEINEVWLSDRDRFSYLGLQHEERLRSPMIKTNGKWHTCTWIDALNRVTSGLQTAINKFSANEIGALVSPNVSIEEAYLIQKYLRGLDCYNIDHRLRTHDFRDQEMAPLFPNLGVKYSEIEELDSILVIGSNVHKELPLLGLKLRKAALNFANISVVNPIDYTFNFDVQHKDIVENGDLLTSLAGILKYLLEQKDSNIDKVKSDLNGIQNLIKDVNVETIHQEIGKQLLAGDNSLVFLGQISTFHPEYSRLIALANIIAKATGSKFGVIPNGSNAAGCHLAGCLPHRLPNGVVLEKNGKDAFSMLKDSLRVYLLFGIEPEFDSVFGGLALEKIKQSELVIAFSPYISESLQEIADIILPITPHSECFATKVNIDGTWQSNPGCIKPFAESRPLWKVMRVLGNLASLNSFEYSAVSDVLDEVKSVVKEHAAGSWHLWCPSSINLNTSKSLTLIPNMSLYAVDNIVRRSHNLQQTLDANNKAEVHLSADDANELQVSDSDVVEVSTKDGVVKLTVVLNTQVPRGAAWIPFANKNTLELGLPYQTVDISK